MVVEELARGTAGGAERRQHRAVADDDQALPRGARRRGEQHDRVPPQPPRRAGRAPGGVLPLPARVLAGAAAVIDGRSAAGGRRRSSRRRRTPARCASGAARTSARRRRASRRDVERLIRAGHPAGADRGARALGARRGAGDRPSRWRSARSPTGCVGVAAFFARPRCATCWPGCGCWPTPPTPAAVVRALSRPPIELRLRRPRALRADRAAPASSTWSAALVAANESPQIPPEARERILRLPQAPARGGRRRSTRCAPTSSCTG